MEGTRHLTRAMDRWDLIALAINGVIGSAIFGLPSSAARLAGSWSPIATLTCAVIVLLMVLCFAEAASLFIGTGGPYLYAREAFGPKTGLAAGWMMWLARLTAFAANSNLMVSYVGFFIPSANNALPRVLLLTAVSALLAWVNVRGVRLGASVGDALAAVKLVPLLGFVLVGLFFIQPGSIDLSKQASAAPMGEAVLLYVFAYTGFEYAAIPAGEALRPKKDLPPAMIIAIGAATVLYVGIQTVCLGTLPELAASRTAMADSAVRFLGPLGGGVIALAALASILGNLSGMALISPRLTFALAQDGLLPRQLAAVHQHFHTPWVSILLYVALALSLAVSGTFEGMLRVSAVARIVPFSLSCLSVPFLRRKHRDEAERFRVPGGPLIPILAVVLSGWLLLQSPGWDIAAAGGALVAGYVLSTLASSPAEGPAEMRAGD